MSNRRLNGCVYYSSVHGSKVAHGNHGRGAMDSPLGTKVSGGGHWGYHAWDVGERKALPCEHALLSKEAVFHNSKDFQAIFSTCFYCNTNRSQPYDRDTMVGCRVFLSERAALPTIDTHIFSCCIMLYCFLMPCDLSSGSTLVCLQNMFWVGYSASDIMWGTSTVACVFVMKYVLPLY